MEAIVSPAVGAKLKRVELTGITTRSSRGGPSRSVGGEHARAPIIIGTTMSTLTLELDAGLDTGLSLRKSKRRARDPGR
jgi:hypothetical protein